MAKFELRIGPGEALPLEFVDFLEAHFPPRELDKLKKFGGRIQLSITAPYIESKPALASPFVPSEFILLLRNQPDNAQDLLKTLTKDQLQEVALMLDLRHSSKATLPEIRKRILDHLKAVQRWNEIASA